MLDEGSFGIAFLRVTERGVQRPTTFVGMRPDDGMVRRHRSAAVGAFVQRRKHCDVAARVSTKVVPLVAALPRTGQRGGGGMRGIFDLNRRVLNIGMPVEIGADERPVERPVVFRVAGRMNAHETTPAADEPLERGFLRRVQYVACRGEK